MQHALNELLCITATKGTQEAQDALYVLPYTQVFFRARGTSR
jgi:hypothetical protein